MTKRYTFEQFAAVRQFAPAVAYSPDGTRIAYVDNASGQMNLSVIPSGGGEVLQLTHFTEHAVREFAWSPDGQQIAFFADHDSDERHQIYLIAASGGEPRKLTAADQAQHTSLVWSPDSKTLAYAANDRDPAVVEVILHDVASGETRRPIKPKQRYYPMVWSPDGEHLTLWARMPGMDQNIVLMHMSGDHHIATQHDGNDIRCMPGPWTPDSRSFFMLLDQEQEFLGLARYMLDYNRWVWVKITDHDIEFVKLSQDGRYLIWCENVDGCSALYGRDLYREQDMTLPALPQGVVKAMSLKADGTHLALVFERALEAATLLEIDLKSGAQHTLTQSMLGGIDLADLIEPKLVTFPTFDGRQIPAWLFRPRGAAAGEKHPALLSIHGGPESQERPEYLHLGLYQYLAHRGFVVLCPNIRGSTGYGISYQKLIRRDWGGDELKDIEHAALYLRSLPEVDSARIGVHGRSFGGFATLSAVSRLPQYWACGVDVVGPANLPTFLKATPPFWKSFIKQWCGDPDEDYDFLVSRSPTTYAEHIKCPLLVIQGAKDPRVVQAESAQMVERIRAAGGDVTYYVDERSGHVPTRREDHFLWISKIAAFLEEKLSGKASS
ncbi:MAG: S9 family peptidase [Chloroflexi bacterium]|nr:S9 family peptidase [Chloroflexota bacterium]